MSPERNYAKKMDDKMSPSQRNSATLMGHLQDVDRVARKVVDSCGETIVSSMGLPSQPWLSRLRTALPFAARLHDLGKANSHFQRMIRNQGPQAVRHEALSVLYLLHPAMLREEFEASCDAQGIEQNVKHCILLAVLNHHTKFNKGANRGWPGQSMSIPGLIENGIAKIEAEKVRLPFSPKSPFHNDFLDIVRWALGVGVEFPTPKPSILSVGALHERSPKGFLNPEGEKTLVAELHQFTDEVLGDERHPECWQWRAFARGMEGLLISCDVMGSALPFAFLESGSHDEAMECWLEKQVGGVLTANDCEAMLRSRLGDSYELRGFQEESGKVNSRVTLVTAGCGTGKTIAAYNWAKRHASGRKLFFSYPTTGLATEGFHDYMEGAENVDSGLVHSRAAADVVVNDILNSDEEGNSAMFAQQTLEGLKILSKQSVSCTVDTIFGTFNLSGKAKIGMAALLQGALVLDEAHAYDDQMFDTCIRILKEYKGLPALIMTATLPPERIERLKREFDEEFSIINGPPEQASNKKLCLEFRRKGGALRDIVKEAEGGGKVLVVVNTVEKAIQTIKAIKRNLSAKNQDKAFIYHSRYRYKDRREIHRKAIDAFQKKGTPSVLVATQVAEMSLDLDATLLVSELAPVPALIQRFGRLNRKLDAKGVRKAIVVKPEFDMPYSAEELEVARKWCEEMEQKRAFSQQEMSTAFNKLHKPKVTPKGTQGFSYYNVGYSSSRESGLPSMGLILCEDRDKVFYDRNGSLGFRPGGKVELIKCLISIPETRKNKKTFEESGQFLYHESMGLWLGLHPSTNAYSEFGFSVNAL